MPDQVRHDRNGLSSRCVHAEPALICSYSGSSRNGSIRDLVLALSAQRQRCRIRSGMTGMDRHPLSSRSALIRDLRSLDPTHSESLLMLKILVYDSYIEEFLSFEVMF